MNARLILAMSLLVSSACGDDPRAASAREAAIVDGEPTGAFESVVAIALQRSDCDEPPSVLCSGALITARAVLSAAHCFVPARPGLAYEVFVGDSTGLGEDGVAVSSVVTHPGFDETTRQNDLAILWLSRPFDDIAPETLPGDAALGLGEAVELVGFGATAPGTVPDGAKRVGTGRVSSTSEGVAVVDPDPSVSCVGDSGGPLFTVGGANELVAVASSGDPGCREESVYALVAPSIDDFIQPTLDEGPPSEVTGAETCVPSISGPPDEANGQGGGCGIVPRAASGAPSSLPWLLLLAVLGIRGARKSWR